MRTTSVAPRIPIAVFDLDGTCLSGQSGLLVSNYLLRHGLLSPYRVIALTWWGIRYKTRLPHRQEEARELVVGALNKHRPSEVAATLADFHDEILLSRYREAARNEITRCKKNGCVVLLVSATFDEVAQIAAAYLGVDDVIATKMERDADGRYTGVVAGPVIEGHEKLTAVVTWANQRYGRNEWYLARAYGDHHTDIPLLAAALEPCAVCPTSGLAHAAHKRDWLVRDWSHA